MEFLKSAINTFFSISDYSSALKFAYVIANAEDEPNEKIIEELNFIQKNTTKTLRLNFYLAWNLISTERNANRIVEMKQTGKKPKYREFTIGDMIIEVQKAHQRLCELVGQVAYKYDLSIPIKEAKPEPLGIGLKDVMKNEGVEKGKFKLPVIK